MEFRGIKRSIDAAGRVVTPKEFRDALDIKNGESVEIFLTTEGILIKKYLEKDK